MKKNLYLSTLMILVLLTPLTLAQPLFPIPTIDGSRAYMNDTTFHIEADPWILTNSSKPVTVKIPEGKASNYHLLLLLNETNYGLQKLEYRSNGPKQTINYDQRNAKVISIDGMIAARFYPDALMAGKNNHEFTFTFQDFSHVEGLKKYYICVYPSAYGTDIEGALAANQLHCLDPYYGNTVESGNWVSQGIRKGHNISSTVPQMVSQPFSILSNYSSGTYGVRNISVWPIGSPTGMHNYRVTIHTNNVGQPGTELVYDEYDVQTEAHTSCASATEVVYNFSDEELTDGTQYWITITSDETSGPIACEGQGLPNDASYKAEGVTTWSNLSGEQIFFQMGYVEIVAGGGDNATNITFVSPTPSDNTIATLNYSLNISTQATGFGADYNQTQYLYNSTGSQIASWNGNNIHTLNSTYNFTTIGVWYYNATATNGTNTSITETRTLTTRTSITITSPSANLSRLDNEVNLTWSVGQNTSDLRYIVREVDGSGSVLQVLNDSVTDQFYYIDFLTKNITLLQSHLQVLVNDSISSLVNDTITMNTSLVNYLNVTVTRQSDSTSINSFTVSLTNGTTIRNETTTTGLVHTNVTRDLEYNINVTATGYLSNATNFTPTGVSNYYHYNFSLIGLSSYNIIFYDEKNYTQLSEDVTLEVFSDDFSQNYTAPSGAVNISNLTIGSYTLRFSSANYTERFYYLTVDETTETLTLNLSLYMIQNVLHSNVTIYVIDEFTSPVSGVLVTASKYNLSSNSYVVQEIATTDVAGKVLMTLSKNTEFYKFSVTQSGVVVKTTSPAYIVDDDIYISIGGTVDVTGTYFEQEDIVRSLYFTPDAFFLDFTYPSGANVSTLLTVYRLGNLSLTLVNSSNATGVSGILSAGVTNISNVTYYAYGYYYSPSLNRYVYFAGASYTYKGDGYDADLGVGGLLIQALLTLGLSSVAFLNVPIALIIAPASLALGKVMGLHDLPTGAVTIMIAIGVMLALTLMSKRR